MDLGLNGSRAVVTGGSKGMGLAMAETLASEGASVAVMARDRAALDAAEETLRVAVLRTRSELASTWPMLTLSSTASQPSPSTGNTQ